MKKVNLSTTSSLRLSNIEGFLKRKVGGVSKWVNFYGKDVDHP